MARKSTSGAVVIARNRSARNTTLPFKTATSTSPSSYASDSSAPSRRTPACSSSAEMRTVAPTASAAPALSGVLAQRLAQHRRSQPLAEVGQLAEGVDRLSAGGRVALLEHGHDDLLEEARLALGRHLVHAQV